MQFPHLKETDFPHLSNASTASPEVTFDYSVWQPGQRVHLCNVPWRAGYADTVDWTAESRDAYFDESESLTLEPITASRRVDSVLRLNLPYADAILYNYVYTDYFPYPVPGGSESRRLYYFIVDARELAPNTTELELEPDLWTTYRPDIELGTVFLERGHAPADALSVEDWLANPLEQHAMLGAPEAIAPSGERVDSADDCTVFAGEKAIVFSLPIPPNMIAQLLAAPSSSGYSEATFSTVSGRTGYEYKINGLRFGVEGIPLVNSAKAEPSAISTSTGMVPGNYLYACKADSVFSSEVAFSQLMKSYPGLAALCEAAFIMPRAILETRALMNIGSVSLESVIGVESPDFVHKLRAEDFAHCSRYAKAYSWPYSWYTLDVPGAGSLDIRIEAIAGDSIIVDNLISLSAPAAKWFASVRNIGNDSARSVAWKRLDSGELLTRWNGSAWAEHMVELDIPTYEMRLPAYVHDAMLKARDATAVQDSAEVAYHNAARVANTDLENVKDANATNTSNVASAGETSTSNVNIGCAAASANTNIANEASEAIVEQNNRHMSFEAIRDNALNTQLTNAQNEAAAITTSNSGMGSIAGGVTSGIISGAAEIGTLAAAGSLAGPVGAAAGAAIGLGHVAIGALQSGIGVAVAQANSQVSINLSSAQASAMNARNSARATASADTSSYNTVQSNNSKVDETDTSNAASRAQNANNVALANLQASRNESTVNANTQYSRNAHLKGEQDNLNLQARNYSRGILNSAMGSPSRFGVNSGDPTFDNLGLKGYTLRARSADSATLARIESKFDREGYEWDREWDLENVLASPEHLYSYIKAPKVYSYSGNIPGFARDAIFAIIELGTTVWSDPSRLGKAAPYER